MPKLVKQPKNKFPHLEPFMSESVVRKHERGWRRYFPISDKTDNDNDWQWLKDAAYIIYGKEATQGKLIAAIFLDNLPNYVEQFDNKTWVRTSIAIIN